MTIKEDKVMYVQHNRGRGHEHGGRSFYHNESRSHGNNNEERGQMNQQNCVDEVVIVEETVVQIVQMLNVTIVENMDITQKTAMPRREWKKMQI